MLKVDNPKGPCRCLVVSCERHIARLIQANLERQKYDVSTAWDMESAGTQVDAGGFDLAVLFEQLPEIDGPVMIQAIRTGSSSKAHIILMSPRAHTLRGEQNEYCADQYIQVSDFWPRIWRK